MVVVSRCAPQNPQGHQMIDKSLLPAKLLAQPCYPPLAGSEAQWAKELLKQQLPPELSP